MMFPVRAALRAVTRRKLLSAAILAVVLLFYTARLDSIVNLSRPLTPYAWPSFLPWSVDRNGLPPLRTGEHPIDVLVRRADHDFKRLLSKESTSLPDAAAAYRTRRGRHPPPGFDAWYRFAKANNALIIEEFWDQIYEDLAPFWGLPALEIRRAAWDFEMTINIRNGTATARSDWFWTQIWLNMTQEIQHLLPDMDVALNAMDEPRVVVPWEVITAMVERGEKEKGFVKKGDVESSFGTLARPGEGSDREVKLVDKEWEATRPYWKIARRGCPPDSPARQTSVMTNFDHAPGIHHDLALPHSYHGFVANYTLSTSICHQPDLQGLEGIFISPLSISTTKHLFPIFGGSKLSTNNEILLPAPMYWNEEERFTGGASEGGPPWPQKHAGVMWRGVASGGRNSATNWRGFQRHRFVAMSNGTAVSNAERNPAKALNFLLPPITPSSRVQPHDYTLTSARRAGRLGEWLKPLTNVSFIDLACDDDDRHDRHGHCGYTDPYFSLGPTGKGEGNKVPLREQFDYKILPDIDGNSFSGRYLAFLRSSSLPVKATLWKEWHDSRLVAWRHFVPMDNRFGEWWAILEYFLGDDGGDHVVEARDVTAERIAYQGREWAAKVLRKEDMLIYVYRLLLEYARVSDPRRRAMGWVGDLG